MALPLVSMPSRTSYQPSGAKFRLSCDLKNKYLPAQATSLRTEAKGLCPSRGLSVRWAGPLGWMGRACRSLGCPVHCLSRPRCPITFRPHSLILQCWLRLHTSLPPLSTGPFSGYTHNTACLHTGNHVCIELNYVLVPVFMGLGGCPSDRASAEREGREIAKNYA